MNKEEYFIKLFSRSKYIGDDGAVVGKWVFSSDSFFENVHFKREWTSLKNIAKKAMLVNISDAVAMNAKPKYALLNVAIPPSYTDKELKELSKGFKSAAKRYAIEIIGGDTISNIKLDISVTIISKTKKPIFRKGCEAGDLLCYTGDIGSSKKDLRSLLRGKKPPKRSKFLKPELKAEFFYDISKYLKSALDISDGLFFELERISIANGVGFEFFERIDKELGCSGEEYEMLFSFDKKHLKKIIKKAKKHNVKLNVFAKAAKGRYRCECRPHHFEK